jgi:hypothetical protein
MALQFTTSYIEDSIAIFQQYKKLAERAMEQVSDEHLFRVLDPEMNCIGQIVKHLSGNMRSRWTDFLTTDGEKPDRNRDSEFVDPPASREAMLALWQAGWQRLLETLSSLSDQDLARTVKIRSEAHSVMQAVNRQIAHTAYHCGQIVLLSKHFGSNNWQALTVPRGKSEEFNRRVFAGQTSQR